MSMSLNVAASFRCIQMFLLKKSACAVAPEIPQKLGNLLLSLIA